MRPNRALILLSLVALPMSAAPAKAPTKEPPEASAAAAVPTRRPLEEIRAAVGSHHPDGTQEVKILSLLEAPTTDLNALIAGLSAHELHLLKNQMDDHWHGPRNRTAFLNLLSQERLGDLNVASRAKLIEAVQIGDTDARDEAAILNVFLGTKGRELTLLKNAIDQGGDPHDLQQLVFRDVDNSEIRARLLRHIALEGAAVATGQLKVLSDIDDTFYENLHDKRYPKQTVYPGVRQFYRELDAGGTNQPDATGDLIFLTARPSERSGLIEGAIFSMLRRNGITNAALYPGDLTHLRSKEAMADMKFRNWKRLCELYPEYGTVFIGDSGQGDAIFAARAMKDPAGVMKKAFIHNVTDLAPERRKAFLEQDQVYVFDTYVGAATEAYRSKLITKAGLRRVARVAREELDAVVFTSPGQQAARKRELQRDIDAMNLTLQAGS